MRIKADSPRIGWNVSGGMDKWIGKVMTIRSIIADNYFFMEEDKEENNGLSWMWAKEDFEKAEERKKDMEIKKEFTKDDLKDGMLCQMRDGEKMLWLYGEMRGISKMCSGTGYNLKAYCSANNCDIVKVGYPNKFAYTINEMLTMDFGEVIWQEEKVSKDVSLEEINSLLKEKYPDVDTFNIPIKDGETK